MSAVTTDLVIVDQALREGKHKKNALIYYLHLGFPSCVLENHDNIAILLLV